MDFNFNIPIRVVSGKNAVKNNAGMVHCNSQITFKDDEKDFIRQEITSKVQQVKNGILENSEIMHSFMFKSENSHNGFVWAKLYSRQLVEKVFETLPMIYCTLGEDLCLSFFFNLFAEKYVGVSQEKVYKYNYVTGISVYRKNISPRQFEQSCSVSSVFTILFSYLNDRLQSQLDKNEEQSLLMYKKALQEKCMNFVKQNIDMLKNSVENENYEECRNILLDYWGENLINRIETNLD